VAQVLKLDQNLGGGALRTFGAVGVSSYAVRL